MITNILITSEQDNLKKLWLVLTVVAVIGKETVSNTIKTDCQPIFDKMVGEALDAYAECIKEAKQEIIIPAVDIEGTYKKTNRAKVKN